MALAKCKECGSEVASSAPTCPQCGVSHPGRIKTGFNFLAFFFPAQYYAGYGQFGIGTIFALLLCVLPCLGLFGGIYAGCKANTDLPVGQKLFDWGLCSGMIAFHIVLAIITTIIQAQILSEMDL
jgi:hypothetical protein